MILNERGRKEVAKALLERTLKDNRRLFPNREKAEALLEELSKQE